MTARIVEVVTKRDRSEELCRLVDQKVLPLVRKLDGFLGKWTLVSPCDPQRIVFFSFWTTPAAVAEYEKSLYRQVCDVLAPLMEAAPLAEVFDVRNGTPINCLVAR